MNFCGFILDGFFKLVIAELLLWYREEVIHAWNVLIHYFLYLLVVFCFQRGIGTAQWHDMS